MVLLRHPSSGDVTQISLGSENRISIPHDDVGLQSQFIRSLISGDTTEEPGTRTACMNVYARTEAYITNSSCSAFRFRNSMASSCLSHSLKADGSSGGV